MRTHEPQESRAPHHPRRGIRTLTGLLAAAVILHVGGGNEAAASPGPPPAECVTGRFLVAGEELLAGAATAGLAVASHVAGDPGHGRVLVLENGNIAIDGLCGPTAAVTRRRKEQLRIKAKWTDCDSVAGRLRLRAVIDTTNCQTLRGTLRAKKAKLLRAFEATRQATQIPQCRAEDVFRLLQERVFGAQGCRVQTCHGAAAAGGLDLQWSAAHGSLVDAPVANPVAAAAGKRRVVPGDASASFLYQKLTGALAPGEGGAMPSVGAPLDAAELALVRAWIEGGAPATGALDTAPCLPAHEFEPAFPLSKPPGGHQIVLNGPTLDPGEEIEGCMWVRVPNDSDFVVGHWEYSLNPGTHHFAVWEQRSGGAPTTGVFAPGDVACLGQGARFAISLSGAPEAPYFVDAYPAGVGKVIKGGSYLGLNPHYYNEFDVPVQVKIWINLHPVAGPVQHVADTLLSQEATLAGRTSYSISVPPYAVGTLRLRYRNPFARPMRIFNLSSHQHQRGTRFTAWRASGEKLFENFDWAHPEILIFDPPFTLAPGEYVDYECEHDNGVTRPVRRCGDAPADQGCTPGEPVPLTFGVSAEDDMCFLTGLYYLD
jgi:hypothetical protein